MSRALKLTEAAAIALHSAALMAAFPDRLLSTRVIAGRFQVSEAHLSKVLQRLVKAGLVSSIRGPKGGFSLTRSPEETTLLEVYEAIEGPIESIGCLFTTPACEGTTCILGSVMGDLNDALRRHLEDTRLVDIRHVFLRSGEPELVPLGSP